MKYNVLGKVENEVIANKVFLKRIHSLCAGFKSRRHIFTCIGVIGLLP